jgi:hypothetical protein
MSRDFTRYDSVPDIAELHRLFRYDSGSIYWRVARGRAAVGRVAGKTMRNGYLAVVVSQRTIYIHRVIFAMHHGHWPVALIDHINHIRDDNRIENLRAATPSENLASRSGPTSRNTSGFLGVGRGKSDGTWRAYITVNRRFLHLGIFNDPRNAAAAYNAAARTHFGEFASENPL